MSRFVHVVGARPNFVKAAPVVKKVPGDHVVIHTGQHFDASMSLNIIRELDLKVDFNLGLRSVRDMIEPIAAIIDKVDPNFVVVYGDTDSTLAGALAAAHQWRYLVHVEAGLRSGDWSMPEERNRIAVDHISAACLAPSEDAVANLKAEGIPEANIELVGNIMIDSLVEHLPEKRTPQFKYGILTLHRPSNVDDQDRLKAILGRLSGMPLKFFFPVHPRTKPPYLPHNIIPMAPQGYKEFLGLVQSATVVVTDSGGIQEETTYLGVPCLTIRDNTERPVTVTLGTNSLVTVADLPWKVLDAIENGGKKWSIPPLWDGKTGERIAECLKYR